MLESRRSGCGCTIVLLELGEEDRISERQARLKRDRDAVREGVHVVGVPLFDLLREHAGESVG